MAKAKRKPLSFSTTLRNPDRIAKVLNCILPYENEILTNEVIYKVIKSFIANKIYTPYYISRIPRLLEIKNDEDASFTDAELNEIIQNSPQKHKEAGFDYGWPSRFDTFYKLPMEFGFIKYSMNEPILISHTGHLLIDAINETPANDDMIQNIFLNAMMKYQTNNPYRKNLNDNVPLILLLEVIDKIKKNTPDAPGLFRSELSFLICWPDNNAEKAFEYIMSFRKRYSFSQYSDELIYDACLKLLGYGPAEKEYVKMEKVTSEAVDEYIRKMRLTGVISLRGNGRFIDFNNFALDKIKYILTNYVSYNKYPNKDSYYSYMGEIDDKILSVQIREDENTVTSVRLRTLQTFAETYDKQTIINELISVCNKRESRDPVFRIINAPSRFEFLMSIALKQNFEGLTVEPNYSVDDEGLPTFTASGGMADILCRDKRFVTLVEVSLMCGRQQVHNEMIPIARHLKENGEESVAVFIAPSIHDDTKRYSRFIRVDENLIILPFDISYFADVMSNYDSLDKAISIEGKVND